MNVFSAPRGEKAAGSRLKRAESFQDWWGIAATLGIAAGYLLRDLIVDQAVFQVKEAQLNRIGKTEVRMKDAAGSIFWARLTSKGENRLLIEDIDIEKNFELDGEDLIEEQEREFSRFGMTPSFQ